VALGALLALAGGPGKGQDVAQGMTIFPVTVELPPGQLAATLTLQNDNDRDLPFQVRPYAWGPPQGADDLSETDLLAVSPPLGVVRAHQRQVVRLVLRRPAGDREAAYRILVDQIPPPPKQGEVNFQLRLSIPVFAEPAGRAAPQVRWRLETTQAGAVLVAVNDGARRLVVRDMVLIAPGGRPAEVGRGVSPYILAGATRRWPLAPGAPAPRPGEDYRLKAHADTGALDQVVTVQRAGP
jgi:fimbrial chaperone protein